MVGHVSVAAAEPRGQLSLRGSWVPFLGVVLRRIGGAIIVILAAATIVFFLVQLTPGNQVRIILGTTNYAPSPKVLAAINAEYGFNHPLIVQYLEFMGRLLVGNFGTSYTLKQSVSSIVLPQMWPTIVLTLTALALAWVLATISTLLTAGRGRIRSALGSGTEIVLTGLPQFWLGTLLLVVFAVELGWLPAIGGTSVEGLALPALTLALPLAGYLGQVTRDQFDDVLLQPFVVSARARGMGEGEVRRRHVLRHAVMPGVTLSGWALGSLLSGSVIVEVIYARPGIGQVLVTAVETKDMPVIVGVTIVVAAVYVIANLLVDFLYVIIDPRLKRRLGR